MLAGIGCSAGTGSDAVGETRAPVELSQSGEIFALATTLTGVRSSSARFREWASEATGAILPQFVDDAGSPLVSSNGTRLRGSCGVTFVAPSYAITAAHCVDSTTSDLTTLTVEMYRPTPELDQGYLRAAALGGTFPSYEHGTLGPEDGYFVDRYDCTLVSRCSDLYGGPVQCEDSAAGDADTALVHCEGAPGRKYGFLGIAAQDDATAEVFMPWKHEVYAIPDAPADDRWAHYVVLDDQADNYHYFGASTSGIEQNQLLPLVSIDFDDGTPHRKLGIASPSVSTDLWGCHGTSGAGVLQQGANGLWQLLGPAVYGDPELSSYLCNHIPSLDGTCRTPGCLGVGYESLDTTQYIVTDHQAALEADCDPFAGRPTSLYTHLTCWTQSLASEPDNLAFVDHLIPPSVSSPLDYLRGSVVALGAGETVGLTGFAVEAGVPYRLGITGRSDGDCSAEPCPRLSVGVGGRELVVHSFDAPDAAAGQPIPFAAGFVAAGTGVVTLSLHVDRGEGVEIGDITLRAERTVNTFDSMSERLEASLVYPDEPSEAAGPMRFVGDGRAGFAAWLLPNERMIFTRQALAPGGSWIATFTATPRAALTCGLLDEAGRAALVTDCSAGSARLVDTVGPPVSRLGFFVQARAESPPVAIDDVQIASAATLDRPSGPDDPNHDRGRAHGGNGASITR